MAEAPLFSVHRSELLPALIAAASAVEKGSKIDILQNIMLHPDGDILRLRATDMTIEIETTCEILGSTSSSPITLSGDDLKSIVQNLPESAEIKFLAAQFPDSCGQIEIYTSDPACG
jgi:DNA polymerase III subunit beta